MLIKCIKPLTIEYNSFRGVCGDGCCGGLDSGVQDQDFEIGEVYEVDDKLVYQRDDYDYVYLNEDLIVDYFQILA